MALSKEQLGQLGYTFYEAPAAPGYNQEFFGAGSSGVLQKLDTGTAEYIRSLGLLQQTDRSAKGALSQYNTSGGNTITQQSLEGAYGQIAQRQREADEAQRVTSGNAAIKSGNVADVEKYFPGYTLWNGAFVDKTKIPELQAQGATVSGGNVVGAAPSMPADSAGAKLQAAVTTNPNITPEQQMAASLTGNNVNAPGIVPQAPTAPEVPAYDYSQYYKVASPTGYDIYNASNNQKYTYDQLLPSFQSGLNANFIPIKKFASGATSPTQESARNQALNFQPPVITNPEVKTDAISGLQYTLDPNSPGGKKFIVSDGKTAAGAASDLNSGAGKVLAQSDAQITPPQSTNGYDAYYKVGNDVFRTSDNKPVTMGNPDPTLDWDKLKLNFGHLNTKENVVTDTGIVFPPDNVTSGTGPAYNGLTHIDENGNLVGENGERINADGTFSQPNAYDGLYKVKVPVTADNPGGYDIYKADGTKMTYEEFKAARLNADWINVKEVADVIKNIPKDLTDPTETKPDPAFDGQALFKKLLEENGLTENSADTLKLENDRAKLASFYQQQHDEITNNPEFPQWLKSRRNEFVSTAESRALGLYDAGIKNLQEARKNAMEIVKMQWDVAVNDYEVARQAKVDASNAAHQALQDMLASDKFDNEVKQQAIDNAFKAAQITEEQRHNLQTEITSRISSSSTAPKTESEREASVLADYGAAFVPDAKYNGTTILGPDGYMDPKVWKEAIADAISNRITRATFIKQFGYLINTNKKFISEYKLTPQELTLING